MAPPLSNFSGGFEKSIEKGDVVNMKSRNLNKVLIIIIFILLVLLVLDKIKDVIPLG